MVSGGAGQDTLQPATLAPGTRVTLPQQVELGETLEVFPGAMEKALGLSVASGMFSHRDRQPAHLCFSFCFSNGINGKLLLKQGHTPTHMHTPLSGNFRQWKPIYLLGERKPHLRVLIPIAHSAAFGED